MFSSRTPDNLAPNRWTAALENLRRSRRPFIDLTESNPTAAGFEYPRNLLAALGDSRALVYAPDPFGLVEARCAVAADYGRRGIEVAIDRLVLTASTSEAYSLLFKLLADPGDEVLVPRPSYPLFEHLTRLDAVAMRHYDLEYHGRWSIDVASVERAMTSRTRAVLVVSPNNPTGSFVRQQELDRLAELCAAVRDQNGAPHPAAIVADEVFADYAIDGEAAAGAARPVERRDVLTFSLGGLSKSIALPQVKLGWIAIGGPEMLVDAAVDRLQLVCDAYLSVSTPVQAAAADLLSRGAAVRGRIQSRVAVNLAQLASAVAAVPSCSTLHTEGGWYGVLRVPSLQPEEDLVVDLLENRGVAVHPGYFFDFSTGAHLIVSLIVPETQFADGIDRVLRHFDCRAGSMSASDRHA